MYLLTVFYKSFLISRIAAAVLLLSAHATDYLFLYFSTVVNERLFTEQFYYLCCGEVM